jgi:DNA-binding beta-propeller fold protein YncE
MKITASVLRWSTIALGIAVSGRAQSDRGEPYHVSQVFQVAGDGGWDYLTVDPSAGLLYVPRTTHTMVVDAKTGRIVADIPGQKHNHGVAIVPAAGRGFITDGEDGSVVVFDLKSFRVLGKIKTEPDADGIIYDPASNKVLLVSGDGHALIPISPDVDPRTGSADPAVDLGGAPEFLAADGRGKVFVNLADKDLVAVVDTKAMKLAGRWPTAPGGQPTAMAIDRPGGRLFIGCRKPQKMIVMSTADGAILADLPLGPGVDAAQFDSDAFASARDGSLTVVRETSPGKFRIIQTVKTPVGARTMGLDPLTHTLYLPTADFGPPNLAGHADAVPETFMIVVVTPTGE